MTNEIVCIASASDFNISKYAKFTLCNGEEHHGKYGYFHHVMDLCAQQFGSFPEYPIKARLDECGLEYFHVEAILFHGIWIKTKRRGY